MYHKGGRKVSEKEMKNSFSALLIFPRTQFRFLVILGVIIWIRFRIYTVPLYIYIDS